MKAVVALEDIVAALRFVAGGDVGDVSGSTTVADLGLDSMQIVQAVVELGERTGIDVDVELLDDLTPETTLGELASRIVAVGGVRERRS